MATLNTQTSVVDYLKSSGKDSSFGSRQKLATEKGIANYSGTAEQNTQLLKSLQTPAPVVPVAGTAPAVKEVAPFANEQNAPLPVKELEKAANMPDPAVLVQQNSTDKSNFSKNIADVATTVSNGTQKAIDNLKQQQQDIVTKKKLEEEQKVKDLEAGIQKNVDSTDSADALKRDRELFKVEDTIRQLGDVNAKIAAAQDALNIGLVYEQGRPARLSLISGRSNTLKNQGLATIGALQGVASVLQGNVNLAKSYSDQTLLAIKEDNDRSINALNTLLTLHNDNLVSLTEEEKTITNERIAELKKQSDQLEQDKTDILNLMTQYPNEFLKAGITLTDTKDQAMEKLLPFLSAKQLQGQYQLLDIGGRKKVYDPATQTIIKDLGPSDDSSKKPQIIGTDAYGNNIFGVYNEGTKSFDVISVPNSTVMDDSTLDTAVLNAFAGIEFPSVAAKRAATAQLKQLLAQGNMEEAKDLLQRYVRNSLPATQLDKLTGKEELVANLDSIKAKMDSYVAAGGDLGVFTGLSNSALEKGGFVKDPVLSKIANEIAIAIVDYRKAVTGAAFTEAEKQAYDKIFPSIGNTVALNTAKLESLREVATRQIDAFYQRNLGENNWNTLFGGTLTVPQLPPLNASYNTLDDLLKTQPEYQSLYEAIVKQDPGATDEDVFKQMVEIGSSDFNTELQTSSKGAVTKLAAIPDNTKGGQCGRFVNKLTGLGVGDSYQSKLSKMDPNIKRPEPGMVFVSPYKDTGHIGFILDTYVNENGNEIAIVKDSNWFVNSAPEQIRTHEIPVSSMTGFKRVNLS